MKAEIICNYWLMIDANKIHKCREYCSVQRVIHSKAYSSVGHKFEFIVGVLKMVLSKTKFIISCLWALTLFGIWIVVSFLIGTEKQWWSILYIQPENYGPMALGISYSKIVLFSILFIIVVFLVSYDRKNNSN